MPQIPVTIRNPLDRPLVKVVNEQIATPDPSLGFVYTIPMGYRSSLLCLRLRFIADANVAARTLNLIIANGSGILFQYSNVVPLAAGETDTMVYAAGISHVAKSATNHNALIPLPTAITLEEGDSISVTIDNVQVGDQVDQIVMQSLSQFVAE
jgi:hypothetical protein